MSASLRVAGALNDESTNQPSSISFTPPAGCVAGDIVLVGMGQSSGSNVLTEATGWTPLHDLVSNGSNLMSRVYAKKLSTPDLSAAHVFTSSGGSRTVSGYQVIKDADTLAEIVVATPLTGTTADPFAFPTVTTPEADCFISEWAFARSGLASKLTLAPVSGLVEDAECNTNFTTVAANLALGIYHTTANSGAVGSYGGQSVDANQAITGSQRWTFAVTSKPVVPDIDLGLRFRIVKSDGTVLSSTLYTVKSDGTLKQLSNP